MDDAWRSNIFVRVARSTSPGGCVPCDGGRERIGRRLRTAESVTRHDLVMPHAQVDGP